MWSVERCMTRKRIVPLHELFATCFALACCGAFLEVTASGDGGQRENTVALPSRGDFPEPATLPVPGGPADPLIMMDGRRVHTPEATRGGFEHFITRDGDRLMEGDREFRFIGANMPGLNLPYDYFYGIGERMVLPTPWEQEDGFKTLARMGLTCVRTWNLPIALVGENGAERFKYVLGPRKFNDDAFVTIDHLLALANRYRIRVILSLTADHGDFLGGIEEYASHRGKPRAAFYTDSQIKEDYKATLRYVLTRRNTVTGLRYAEDKAILAWQFGNEMDRTKPGEAIQRAWQAEMAAYAKSLDPQHLIAYGRRFMPAQPDPNIDIIVNHYYGGDWPQKVKQDRWKAKGKRPLIITEFGLETDPTKVAALLDAVIESGVSGAMIWSVYFHHRDGGFWHHGIITRDGAKSYHWPGFETGEKVNERRLLHVLRNRAFTIRGLRPPPIAAPDAPELLPFTDAAIFSWRGAAGAAAYDIQRSPAAGGPWESIATGVTDTVPCYRPLFADASARPGDAWFYRVIARNAGGSSRPSNVAGPIQIRRAVLADELKTFDLAVARSDGLRLIDKDNYHFAEHYYRAEGTAGDWLTYAAPAGLKLDGFKLSVWNPTASPGIRVLVSKSGQEWWDVTPTPNMTSYKPYYAKGAWKNIRATEHQIETDGLPPGMRQIKLLWPGEALLDRVDLRFR